MIKHLNDGQDIFILHTDNTSYIIAVAESGHPEHLYYGARIDADDPAELAAIRQKREFEPGNSIVYSKEAYKKHPKLALEDVCLEMSSLGHGDIREPFLELVYPDGSRTSDFLYTDSLIDDKKPVFADLPGSYDESGRVEHLCVSLADGDIRLNLHYCVYPECDVITRSAELINDSDKTIEVERLLSMQIDIPDRGFCVTAFHGEWAREMNASTFPVLSGKHVIESLAGASSSRSNPFFMLHRAQTTETAGECYGFNLIYSGNHYSAIETTPYGKTRVVSGLNPTGFRWVLTPGERFEAPEAVVTYSQGGFSGQSDNMHRFIRSHILRGEWKDKARPVLLNSWEASYFNISERSLVTLAKAGKELGIELFVMDDGWFGERDNDSRSLGDWDPNPKKLPGGLSRLGSKITALGMKFGIWVEPEMVNVDSRLYEAHPDWAMAIPGRLHSEGRNQRILDLANPEVVDYMTKKMTEVFSSADISYVKWDMNRIFSDVFSPYLPPEKQGETAHRYMLGLYRMMGALTERFPHILFEGCASGGNRFDLGILCYFPQIWASDNTDALCRVHIQEGYSFGYPQCCYTAHVSASPNHQTLRSTPLESRYNIAAFGVLGYELNVRDMNRIAKEQVRLQITLYKVWRDVLQYGRFYRVESGNLHTWMCVSDDRTQAVGMLFIELSEANTGSHRLKAQGLDPERKYRLHSLSGRVNIKLFGSLINTMTPIHIKQDGLLHYLIARFYKIGGEAEDYTARGSVLMNAGVALRQPFSGTGYNENVRLFPDFSSRMYFIEAID
nr:alpha-galactosidase [uncultured Ruminococcus sp.]